MRERTITGSPSPARAAWPGRRATLPLRMPGSVSTGASSHGGPSARDTNHKE